MPGKNCGVCGARLLKYENPERMVCPRANKHHLYVSGNVLGGGKKVQKNA